MEDHSGERTNPGDITRLLSESAEGSENARDQLFELVHAELLTLARSRMRDERPDHTLSATALVNETYLRLFRVAGMEQPSTTSTDATVSGRFAQSLSFANRAMFFKAAATAMRRILVDHARAKLARKRGGEQARAGGRISLDLLEVADSADPSRIVALDDAISRLEQVDERAASVVRLRFFAGQELAAISEMLGVSERTIKRDWEFARAWLWQTIEQDETG